VAQDDSIGQQTAFNQGVIRPAETRVRYFYQDSILSGFWRGDFFDNQSFGFSVNSGFHFLTLKAQITSCKSRVSNLPGQAGSKHDVVGAALCGRPQDGQPRRVAPSI
jgi:hypothetical protein